MIRERRKAGPGPPATPRFIEPMAAQLVQALPDDPQWIYEVKFDGYRALLIKHGDKVEIRSRNDNDLTAAYPGVQAAGRRLRAQTAIVDGEIVAVDASGRPSFQALQHRRGYAGYTPVFYAFDLMHLNGENLVRQPLEDRRARLRGVLDGSGLFFSEALTGSVSEIVDAVRGLGLEGVVAKRRDAPYRPGARSDTWRKLKLDRQQEFVIGGYRPGSNGVDALLVGHYEGRALHFAGKVRAGFTPAVRRDVAVRLRPLHADRCPFVNLPNAKTSRWEGGVTAEQMHEMQWVKPRLLAQVRFVEFTADGRLRHPAFLGLRTDKKPSTVVRER